MAEHSHCQDLLSTISEYVDGTLQAELCSMLEAHLDGCENCKIVVNTLRKTLEIYQENADEKLPGDVRERLFVSLNLEQFMKSS